MTEDEDLKEFEEWWQGLNPIDLIINKKPSVMEWIRESWLASRRLLREKKSKKLLGDNENREWMYLHNVK